MPSERRTQERFFFNLKARISYQFFDEATTKAIETVAANISAGGAFLQTQRPLPLSGKVQVEFLLSGEDLKKLKFILSMSTLLSMSGNNAWVKATGIVIRRENHGVAVIFDQNYQLTPMHPVSESEQVPLHKL